ncbi:ferredoxin [Streptomyces sp. BA2]|uniref:ferredoxin n=1 Tax=Streptomyces sp. BA2 TaxID=436595 RepID=UPI0013242353|nr:ferredoxin [Streptomyces sp. BA2]MWA16132.1 ferredoxin [Streptomyces sp. BA2]
MTEDWQLDVESRLCIGSGVCASAAPHHFTLDSTRRSRPTAAHVTPDDRVLNAAFTCPVEAISVVERSTGLTLFPEEEERQ